MIRPNTPVLLSLLLALAGPSAAQPPVVAAAPAGEAAQLRPATLALEAPGGGSPREYQVDDVSIAVSGSVDGRGEMRADVTISLGTLRPLDTFLLEWARQGEAVPGGSRKAVITVPPPQSSVPGTVARYELEGAKVLAFSASHSAAAGMGQVMIQVSVRRVTLNGVVLN